MCCGDPVGSPVELGLCMPLMPCLSCLPQTGGKPFGAQLKSKADDPLCLAKLMQEAKQMPQVTSMVQEAGTVPPQCLLSSELRRQCMCIQHTANTCAFRSTVGGPTTPRSKLQRARIGKGVGDHIFIHTQCMASITPEQHQPPIHANETKA
jgi:hypothetical protein